MDRAKPANSSEVESGHQPACDKVSLSAEAVLLRDIGEQLKLMPDVREEMVMRLKETIKAGTYSINAEKIAAKLVKEALIDAIHRGEG